MNCGTRLISVKTPDIERRSFFAVITWMNMESDEQMDKDFERTRPPVTSCDLRLQEWLKTFPSDFFLTLSMECGGVGHFESALRAMKRNEIRGEQKRLRVFVSVDIV